MDRHLAQRDVRATVDFRRVPYDFPRTQTTDHDHIEQSIVEQRIRRDPHSAAGGLAVAHKDGSDPSLVSAAINTQRDWLALVAKGGSQERNKVGHGSPAEFSS